MLKEMVKPIADDMARVCAGMTDLELATPASVGDLLSQAGFRAGRGTLGHVEDTSLGAGVQSLLMFHVLYMIDQGQFQDFGWKQAAVWAVEEPESSLHRQLQVRLAGLLRAYALGDDSRFQILMTTHNDVFIFGGTSGYIVSLDDSFATVAEPKPIMELAREAASLEVTSLPSPALHFPFETLVVTEGDIDAQLLTHVAALKGFTGIKFATPSQLDQSLDSDGVENVKRFVQSHARSAPQRLSGYPLLVILDWEVPDDKVRSIATKYGPAGSVYVRKMDEHWAENAVGSTFRGIERFYPETFLRAAEADNLIALAHKNTGELIVTPQDLNAAKMRLAARFLAKATADDCSSFVPAIEWIDGVRNGALL